MRTYVMPVKALEIPRLPLFELVLVEARMIDQYQTTPAKVSRLNIFEDDFPPLLWRISSN